MACDMCGKTGCDLVRLNEGYKTDDIQDICSDCSRLVNDHLWKLRKVMDGTVKTTLKKWIANFKENKS